MKTNFSAAIVKALIVLIPTYAVAFWTEKMVYVVPMLAAAGFIASSLEMKPSEIQRRVDEDGEASEIESASSSTNDQTN